MIYAQIKDGIIKNVIILNDANFESVFIQDFDFLIRIDELDPCPARYWSYDSGIFTPPEQE